MKSAGKASLISNRDIFSRTESELRSRRSRPTKEKSTRQNKNIFIPCNLQHPLPPVVVTGSKQKGGTMTAHRPAMPLRRAKTFTTPPDASKRISLLWGPTSCDETGLRQKLTTGIEHVSPKSSLSTTRAGSTKKLSIRGRGSPRRVRHSFAFSPERQRSFHSTDHSKDGTEEITVHKVPSRETRAKVARERFVHAARMIILLSRVSTFAIEKRVHKPPSRNAMTFTEMAEEFQSENMRSSGLSFDPRDFKAKKELDISSEVKRILSSPTESRTPEEIQTAVFGLQSMASFAEYPLHMQEKLVKVAWYESVPPKRVVIRQGHYAENFYFIISGSVVVTILENNPSTGEPYLRTAAVLRRGSSFGELALLHHSRRTATVSSQGPVQLLAIGREDFFDIFMRGKGPGKEPEHIAFIRQLPFMKCWPVDKLVEQPEMCLFHFYKRGQVIVKDSNNSDWIYVVKSGSCQVIRQLTATKAKLHLPIHHEGLPTNRMYPTRMPSRSYTDSKLWSRRRTRKRNKASVNLSSYLDFQMCQSEGDPDRLKVSLDLGPALSNLRFDRTQSVLTLMSHEGEKKEKITTFPSIDDMRKRAVFSRPSYSRSKYRDMRNLHSRRLFNCSKNDVASDTDVKTNEIQDGCDVTSSFPESHIFVQVELLQPRDVFGLSTLNVDLGIDHQQSSVSLVSKGAELIMIRKDCFVRHATAQVRRNLRTIVRAYPTTETLQSNLQNHANWMRYKAETMDKIFSEKFPSHDITVP